MENEINVGVADDMGDNIIGKRFEGHVEIRVTGLVPPYYMLFSKTFDTHDDAVLWCSNFQQILNGSEIRIEPID